MPLLLALTLAVAAPPDPVGLDDVVSIASQETDVYVFSMPKCERIRAALPLKPPRANSPRNKLVVTLQNTGTDMCLYRGVALAGWLKGTYTSSLRNPGGTGIFVPPGGEVSLKLKPTVPLPDTGEIALEIAPGKQMVLITGRVRPVQGEASSPASQP